METRGVERWVWLGLARRRHCRRGGAVVAARPRLPEQRRRRSSPSCRRSRWSSARAPVCAGRSGGHTVGGRLHLHALLRHVPGAVDAHGRAAPQAARAGPARRGWCRSASTRRTTRRRCCASMRAPSAPTTRWLFVTGEHEALYAADRPGVPPQRRRALARRGRRWRRADHAQRPLRPGRRRRPHPRLLPRHGRRRAAGAVARSRRACSRKPPR